MDYESNSRKEMKYVKKEVSRGKERNTRNKTEQKKENRCRKNINTAVTDKTVSLALKSLVTGLVLLTHY
jgi:hypothetical protein